MRELVAAIPDVEVLLDLEPEELGAKILFLVRQRDDDLFHPDTLRNELWRGIQGQPQYPDQYEREVTVALVEAWAWLEAQGLVIPEPGINGQNGFRILSRRALKFENEAEFIDYSSARRLPKEILHERIQGPVWQAFMRGEFDVGVLHAMRAVEIAVRDAAGLDAADIGVNLMRNAFHPETGALRDQNAERGEQQRLSDLFAGAIGSYKYPHSLRNVDLDDPNEALEIILLANHLLRIVDARAINAPAGP